MIPRSSGAMDIFTVEFVLRNCKRKFQISRPVDGIFMDDFKNAQEKKPADYIFFRLQYQLPQMFNLSSVCLLINFLSSKTTPTVLTTKIGKKRDELISLGLLFDCFEFVNFIDCIHQHQQEEQEKPNVKKTPKKQKNVVKRKKQTRGEIKEQEPQELKEEELFSS